MVSDTLRTAHLGCYGNPDIKTPNIDKFAERSMRFTRAYPESLPTIPVRRALHTGRRAYPFRNYRPLKWDMVYLPGWQPIDNDEDTLAENLVRAGYHTGFMTDTLPYFGPGMNFIRGFHQWDFIRGQQQDRWRSPFTVDPAKLAKYWGPQSPEEGIHTLVATHLANTADIKTEEDTMTARVFSSAMRFLDDNVSGQPFYLLVDCFDPHEPWEAPEHYYGMYGDPDYDGIRYVHTAYAPAHEVGYTQKEIDYVVAQYCGLVSLVDTWFGKFVDKLDELGLSSNTVVMFTSDHGTNFCDNPRNVIGKPEYSLYPGLMHLPLLVRLPDEAGAGRTCDEFVYNLDITSTVYDFAGITSPQGLDGQGLAPLVTGNGRWNRRDYVTCRYGDFLSYIDDEIWAVVDIDGNARDMFDLQSDPGCRENVADKLAADHLGRVREALMADAGGELPRYGEDETSVKWTDAIGQRPAKVD